MLKSNIKTDYVEVWDSLKQVYVVNIFKKTPDALFDVHYCADKDTATRIVKLIELGRYTIKDNKVIVKIND